jgi:hypothetical protein
MKVSTSLPLIFAQAFALSAVVTFAGSALWAQDAEQTQKLAAANSSEGVLPEAVTKEHFSAIREQSPFLRNLNLAATYSLRGVAEINGQPVATLYNRETKKTLFISKNEPNDAGIQMIEVVPGRNLGGVTVKVSFGGEVVELKYDSDQLSPLASASSSGGGKGDGKGDGKRKGPSSEERKRYESLNAEQKEKFRQYARQTMQKYPNMSREERQNMIGGALSRLSEGKDVEADPPKPDAGNK